MQFLPFSVQLGDIRMLNAQVTKCCVTHNFLWNMTLLIYSKNTARFQWYTSWRFHHSTVYFHTVTHLHGAHIHV